MISPITLDFPAISNRPVTARFDGGDLSSDAGAVLLATYDKRHKVTQVLAEALPDRRQKNKIVHPLERMLAERVYAIALGYEDANDLDSLRTDPALKLACNSLPASGPDLASQPSLSRLENSFSAKDLIRAGRALAALVVGQLPNDTTEVILDIDATDDPCHGQQEFEEFNAHYDTHCYLPLLLHITGKDGCKRLLGALLRHGRAGACAGLRFLVRTAVRLIRARFPKMRILLRADGGFGNARVIHLCQALEIDFVLGLSKNSRLQILSTPVQMDAALKYAWEGEGCREFGDFSYKAGTWKERQRVVIKAEITRGELNPRYVVTSKTEDTPEDIYHFYCLRGDQENRIKEFKLDLNSGRTSCHRFLANQFRLLLHQAACILMTLMQTVLEGTDWAGAQIATIRLRILKVAVRVIESSRRVWLHLPTSFPNKATWLRLWQRLCANVT